MCLAKSVIRVLRTGGSLVAWAVSRCLHLITPEKELSTSDGMVWRCQPIPNRCFTVSYEGIRARQARTDL